MSTNGGSARAQLRDIAKRVMVAHGLAPEFPAAALAEVAPMAPHRPDAAGTRDLRDLLWCSIDNDDSRDLDQLSAATIAPDGTVTILIAVADVDALVKKGSAVDDHARLNTTSVYTAARIFPMLPEKLSTDLTSLAEGEDRLAVVVEMQMAAGGEVRSSSIGRAIVRNRAKLAYNGVAAWLEGGAAPAALAKVPGLDENLRTQDRIAQAMRSLRHEQGALTLDSIEAHVVFDGETLADLRPDEKNRAKALIEDFMIAANTATARFLASKGYPSIRRVLRAPKRWERIVALAAGLGARLPADPSAHALDEFLRARRQSDPQSFPDLSLSVVKLLGSGEYAVAGPADAPPGHFGLAVRDYTHSTAPNRRFPDLITQRLLKAALVQQAVPYGGDELAALAQHCTLQEDEAAKVERQVHKSAAALLLAGRIGQTFDGIVTGASDKGTYVRILHPAVEGRVVQGFAGLDVGERAHVTLISTDVERGYIDFKA